MGLTTFILRRLVLSLLVLFIMTIATFSLAHAVPGDPLATLIGERQADNPKVRAVLEQRWGLDKPLPVQYAYYLKNLLRGDMGESIMTRNPVTEDLSNLVPATFELTMFAMIYAALIGVPLGIIAAVKQNRWPDHVSRFISLIGTSVPVFWLGLLLLFVFFNQLRWLPGPGRLDVGMEASPRVTGLFTVDAAIAGDWDVFNSAIRHTIMPAVVLGSFALGILQRMLRSSLLASLSDDYVRTARAKGLSERHVVVSHALRNALIPTVTILGLTFANLLAGAVLTETIFSWPGIGQYAARAALRLDYTALLGVTLTIAVGYTLINLIVDISYGILDPRIRVG
ncbi:MAG: ABC transporter permease [Thermomicrobiales bacterium]|nr:ABC transporter permease [Thermomicrobiales bacterium]